MYEDAARNHKRSDEQSAVSAGGTMATRTLQTLSHLACVVGPDRGAMIPLADGEVVGRCIGLVDPHTSFRHATVHRISAHSSPLAQSFRSQFYLHDESQTNSLRAFGKQPVLLVPGRTLKIGANTWHVRRRPLTPNWTPPKPGASGFHRARMLMPVFLVLAIFRLLPLSFALMALGAFLLACITYAAISRRQRQTRWDPASLLLVASSQRSLNQASATTSKPPLPEHFDLLTHPGARRFMGIPLSSTVAVVGDDARAYSQWIAGQLVANGLPCRVQASDRTSADSPGLPVRPVEQHGKKTSHDFVLITWSHDLGDIGFPASTVIESVPVGGKFWLLEMEATTSPTNCDIPPESCMLEELIGQPNSQTIAANWRKSRRDLSSWSFVIGAGSSEPYLLNLVADGPHTLVVGGTGSGKSELLATMVLSLATQKSPEQLRFIFIDYKGGAGLGHMAALPHVEHSLTDLDGSTTSWLLRALRALLNARKLACAEHGVRSIDEWEHRQADEVQSSPAPPPRIIVVADEFRELADRNPGLLRELAAIGLQGRSLGVHLVVATQRPGGSVTADMRAVLDLRIALRCSENADSIDTIGTGAAAQLPRRPGLSLIGDQKVQCAYTAKPQLWIDALCEANQHCGGLGTRLQVPPPLPRQLDNFDVDRQSGPGDSYPANSFSIGVYEDPVTCSHKPLIWSGEPLQIVGPPHLRQELLDIALAVSGVDGRPVAGKAPVYLCAVRGVQRVQPEAALAWSLPAGTGRSGTLSRSAGPGDSRHIGLLSSQVLIAGTVGQTVFLIDQFAQAAATTVPDEMVPTIVLPEISSFRADIEQSLGPQSARKVLEHLMSLTNRGAVRLVVTDTRPRADDLGFSVTLLRILDQHTARRPEFSPLIPTSRTPHAGIDHWISGIPGRVIASRFESNDAVLAQVPLGPGCANLSTESTASHPMLSQARGVPRLGEAASVFELVDPDSLTPSRADRTPQSNYNHRASDAVDMVVVADSPAVEQWLGPHWDIHAESAFLTPTGPLAPLFPHGESNPPKLHVTTPKRWNLLGEHRGTPVLIVEPTRETVRALGSHFGVQNEWIMALSPFPPKTGVLIAPNRTELMILPDMDGNVTVRTAKVRRSDYLSLAEQKPFAHT